MESRHKIIRSEQWKQRQRQAQLGRKISDETRRKIGLASKGRIFSEEHKRKIGLGNMGKTMSEEARKKISIAHMGKKSYIRTEEHRAIMSSLKKGSLCPKNADLIRKRLKGKTWEELYGKERADKLKELARQLRRKNNLIDNPAKHPEVAMKISKAKKGITFEQRYGSIKAEELKLKVARPLEKNGRWLGGKSFEPYTLDFNKLFKEAIRQRDNLSCVKCNLFEEDAKKLYQRGLCIHHVDYVKENTFKENCCSLCVRCHTETNGNREHWTKFFQSLLAERYRYKYQDGKIIMEIANE